MRADLSVHQEGLLTVIGPLGRKCKSHGICLPTSKSYVGVSDAQAAAGSLECPSQHGPGQELPR